jgi:thioredoxin 1
MEKKMLLMAVFSGIMIVLIAHGCTTTADSPLSIPDLSGEPIMLDKTNFSKMVEVPGRISMVEFFRSTCSPCQRMDSVVSEVAVRYNGPAVIGKVDVAKDDTLQYADSIYWTPTFLFFSGGKEARRLIGVQAEDSLTCIIDTLLATVNKK